MQKKKEVATKRKATTAKKAAIKKEDTTNKEENTINNEDIAKKEAPIKKEDSISKEDTDKKEEPVKKEDPTQKDEPVKKEEPAKKALLSEKRIKEIVERLRKQVAEFRQLQEEGKKPMYKRIPITVIEIPHVMLIINRSRNVASEFLQDVRMKLGKKPRQKVSVTEFCKETGIPLDDVRQALNLLT